MSYKTTLVINDLHIPFHNPKAVELALRVGEAAKVHQIVINGDLLDCWELSHFHKNPKLHTVANIKEEISKARRFLRETRERFPNAFIDYIYGNHEFRWDSFIVRNAKELVALKGMTLAEQLECAESKINVIYSGTKESSMLYGKLLIGHFDRVAVHSAFTAKALIESKSISLIQAHTHRGGAFFKRLYDKDIVGYENFCLCDRSPCYVDRPNWQLGFSIVYQDSESDFFYVEQHPIIEDRTKIKTFFGGQCYATNAYKGSTK